MRKLITTKQVQEAYGGISRVTLCKYRKQGKVPKPVIDTTQPKWYADDIERALEALRGATV